MSLNAIVSSRLSPCASRASLSATVAAGQRRQQRFPWLSRQAGSYETMKHHRGGRSRERDTARQREQACMRFCICVQLTEVWHGRERAYVCVSGHVSERKNTRARQRSHTRGKEQTVPHGELRDFPHRVNRASYHPCALEIT